jgi:hypothetical protein
MDAPGAVAAQTRSSPEFWLGREIPLFHGLKLVLLAALTQPTMTLNEAYALIGASVGQMNARYGNTVFDEWVVLSLHEKTGRILNYHGPRKDDFPKSFASDLEALLEELESLQFGVGDFEFARHAKRHAL